MKFIASKTSLVAALGAIHGAVNNNAVIPVLEDFLLEVRNGELYATATDMQITMRTSIKVEAKEEGRIAVPARVLLDTLKNLPEQPLVFTIDTKTQSMQITSEGGKYKISCEKADDFPKVPTADGVRQLSEPIAAKTLGGIINKCAFAISTDDLRPAMTGLLFDLKPTGSILVATDAHKLTRIERSDIRSEKAEQVIIPLKAVQQLKKLSDSTEESFRMEYNTSNAFFTAGKVELITRLVDARYPDYDAVIPANNPLALRVNRMELIAALRRVVLFSNKTTYQVIFNCDDNQLKLSAQDIDFSNEATETLHCVYEGETITIGFNARFVMDSAQVLEGEEVQLLMSDPLRAAIMQPLAKTESEETKILVMPVSINA